MKKTLLFVFLFSVFSFVSFGISNAQAITAVNVSSSLLITPAPIQATSSATFPPAPVPVIPTTTAYLNNSTSGEYITGYTSYFNNDNLTGYLMKTISNSTTNATSEVKVAEAYKSDIVFDYYINNPNIIFYSYSNASINQSGPSGDYVGGAYLMKSIDGGNTWTDMTSGLLSYLKIDSIIKFGGIQINQLKSTPNDITVRVVTSNFPNGVWAESFDGGNTWGPVLNASNTPITTSTPITTLTPITTSTPTTTLTPTTILTPTTTSTPIISNNTQLQQQLIQLMTLLLQLLEKAVTNGNISSNLLNSAIGTLQNISQ